MHYFSRLLNFFSKLSFLKKISGIPSESHIIQASNFDLGPNCLQRLSADDANR